MAKKIEPTMKWEDAPDTVTPEIVSKILGKHVITVRKYFNAPGFPLIQNEFIADKEAARLWFQGLYQKRRLKCKNELTFIRN